MNDLIINGIDHSKFDLEWAKRGGVVLTIMDDSQTKILANLAKYVGEWAYFINATRYAMPDCELYFTCGLSGSSDLEMSSDTHYVERMATPSECAEAGIEYIEPPARWFPIESAPKDGSRILIKEYGTVFVAGWGYVVDDIYGWVIVNDCYIEHSDNLLWMEHPKDK